MPEKQTLERARRDKRQGKAASTQAGEFVKEEMDHIREGKHGARSAKQAIATLAARCMQSLQSRGTRLPELARVELRLPARNVPGRRLDRSAAAHLEIADIYGHEVARDYSRVHRRDACRAAD